MKIVSFTMIGNEEEIIESFVRYNIHFFDKMYFISSCCVDNTLKILRALMQEGCNIELFIEPDIAYDQLHTDNKYLKKIASESEVDLILPIDSDEFIAGNGNPREALESLRTDCIYSIPWKNYVMCPDDNFDEPFIPRRICHAKVDNKTINKVILPGRMISERNIFLETGHHVAYGENVETARCGNLWFAHFPTISREQYLLKVYTRSIQAPILRSFSFNEGIHFHKQLEQVSSGADVFCVAGGYGIDEERKVETIYDPLKLKYCNLNNLEIRYADLAKTDLLEGIRRMGQLMALRSYIYEIEAEMVIGKPKVLIFGTGGYMQAMIRKFSPGIVNITAYIDNDPEKQFRMWDRKLIVGQEYIKFFRYHRIIIMSSLYYSQIFESLIKMGIPKEKICGVNYLMELDDKEHSA